LEALKEKKLFFELVEGFLKQHGGVGKEKGGVGLIVVAIADTFFRSSSSSSNGVCAAAFDASGVACVVGFHRGSRQYCLLGGAQEGNHPESEGRRAY
jgi:hypothetical protein